MVIINTTIAESINGQTDSPVLYGNIFSHLSIEYQATGNAIKQDNPTNKTKFFVIKGTNCPAFAPMTFRMLISFCLCCVVKAINPNNPRQVISIVDMEKAVKILPLFWSA